MYLGPGTVLLRLLTITVVLGGLWPGADAHSQPPTKTQVLPSVGAQLSPAAAQQPISLTIQAGRHSRQPGWNSFNQPLTVEQLVEVAIELNPQVRAAKQQWNAAQHQILQNYAPADPVFTYGALDSDHDFNAAEHTHSITESFQFPGEALLQANQARRNAEIARLTFEAAVRDLRAGIETAYYQVLLDGGLIAVNSDNIANLKQVVSVTQAQYTGGQAAQSDLIGAELALDQALLQQRQYQTNRLNDRSTLNQLLYRQPDSPLNLNPQIELRPLKIPLDKAVEIATHARQEILEAALTAKNSATALKLAQMEYLPNYTVGGEYDLLLAPGTRPFPNVSKGWTYTFGFNLPIFFWIHQREDVLSAQHSLEAARYSMNSVLNQTEVTTTQLYRSAQFAYESAQVYREQLIPLADKEFKVALIAYQSGKVDFLTLSSALQGDYASRLTYLQNANSFFAGQVALEQAMGVSFQQ
ncbi:MAG: TolC family protein [Deltaproteobacteria bacterium]|nr:TolC family protein [Deltaproteobacteria bacterium]